jgi:predicted MFS family arabinose efflux permease
MAQEADPLSPIGAAAVDAPPQRATSNRYLLSALVAIYAFAHLDRQILSLLVEPVKRDLRLSDTQISLLQGVAFAPFMAAAGLPIGRMIDTGRRTAILATGILAWGATTLGCGFASSFWQLMLLRMGVGAGEAVLTPSAHSIVADATPQNRLGLALGVFGVGAYIGAGLAFVLGAFVLAGVSRLGHVHLQGFGTFKVWQLVFLTVGAPALPMALWAYSLPEPRRPVRTDEDRSISAGAAFFAAHFASVGLVNLTGGFISVALYAASAWFPTFLIRDFHWTAPAAGLAFGLVVMVCGAAGVILGGLLGDALIVRGHTSGRLMAMGAVAACAAPLVCAAPLMASALTSLALAAPAVLFIAMGLGLLPSVQQAIAPSHLRGSTSALGALTVNLIGLGLGPTLTALATDQVFHAPAAVGLSLALVAPLGLLIAAGCAVAGLGPYARSRACVVMGQET